MKLAGRDWKIILSARILFLMNVLVKESLMTLFQAVMFVANPVTHMSIVQIVPVTFFLSNVMNAKKN
jgi:hypothetical protein